MVAFSTFAILNEIQTHYYFIINTFSPDISNTLSMYVTVPGLDLFNCKEHELDILIFP